MPNTTERARRHPILFAAGGVLVLGYVGVMTWLVMRPAFEERARAHFERNRERLSSWWQDLEYKPDSEVEPRTISGTYRNLKGFRWFVHPASMRFPEAVVEVSVRKPTRTPITGFREWAHFAYRNGRLIAKEAGPDDEWMEPLARELLTLWY
jgi:hypothetical protein